jgi:putative oxidoreductase
MTNEYVSSSANADHRRLVGTSGYLGAVDAIAITRERVSRLPFCATLLVLPRSLAGRFGGIMLRSSLALIFIWFGALKVTGASPVAALVRATLPWFGGWIVPLIGGIEILLGIGLLVRRVWPLVLLGLTGHLAGTFLTFADAHTLMYRHGNPLLLTSDGEFVLNNLILISGALVLLGTAWADAPL